MYRQVTEARPRVKVSGAWLLAGLLPSLALAHTSGSVWHAHAWDLQAGWLHPFGGIDHLLAMLALGLWAGQRSGRSLWQLPMAFVGSLLVGGLLAMAGVALPAVEPFIVASLVAIGALVAVAARSRDVVAVAATCVFAVFHGLAHGSEIPVGVAPLGYAAGFMTASTALHVVGIGVAKVCERVGASAMPRLAGVAVAATGVLLLVR